MENNSKDRFKDIFIVLTIFCLIVLAIFFLVIQPILNKAEKTPISTKNHAEECLQENFDYYEEYFKEYFKDSVSKVYDEAYYIGYATAKENPSLTQDHIAKFGAAGLNEKVVDAITNTEEKENVIASDFLKNKAAERATIIDEKYGEGTYGGTAWNENNSTTGQQTKEEILAKYGVTPSNNYDKDKIKSVDNSRVKTSVND